MAIRAATVPCEVSPRTADHPVHPLFLQRWSPRSFEPADMPIAELLTILEAARWAPSAHNLQPWRFLYALRYDRHFPRFVDVLDPFNAQWAVNASALVFVLSERCGPQGASGTASFDAGAAWAQLALQATALGYQAHAMAGLRRDVALDTLAVPRSHRIEIAVAIGRQASPERLPAALREREFASGRRPLTALAARGDFGDLPVDDVVASGGAS